MHTTHFLTNGGIQTAYHDIDDGTGLPPFVLVHGFTGSKLDFSNQIPWFSDLARVIALDQRGHGESSNEGPYQEQQFVADLIRFLDALTIDRCDLLGHSFGGMVAMRAVVRHPDRFRSLILMDTTPDPLPMYPPEVRTQIEGLISEHGCDALVPSMRQIKQTRAARRGIDFLGEAEHWRRITVKLEQMDPVAFSQISTYIESRPSALPAIAAIRCPVTVIVGARDQPFVGPSKSMADRIDGARLEMIDYAGHSPQYENAEAWREVVRAHLKRLAD